VILILYVDDLFITGNDSKRITWIKNQLHQEFEMTDLGFVRRYLGIRFQRCQQGIFLNQTDYARDMLREFGAENCKGADIPLPEGLKLSSDMGEPEVSSTYYCQIVGKLIYLTHTRPDLAYAVSVVSRYMSMPQQPHLRAAMHILRYVSKTLQFGILYPRHGDTTIRGYTDADWGSDIETRRSTGGYLFMMGNAPITW